jgi:hypothetical protein
MALPISFGIGVGVGLLLLGAAMACRASKPKLSKVLPASGIATSTSPSDEVIAFKAEGKAAQKTAEAEDVGVVGIVTPPLISVADLEGLEEEDLE